MIRASNFGINQIGLFQKPNRLNASSDASNTRKVNIEKNRLNKLNRKQCEESAHNTKPKFASNAVQLGSCIWSFRLG
ncbi:hypothetical protein BpHYR1_019491 [Brachionus plicatilis]|uniref:Uncharacterized protein n=1 Tax=Brachionus plicatilis TaxID=10195 RepID=A0A3M7RCQ2_BRAPC|nr:hypothetical protein BpHYR1_019491 [Brachionus plicatilis]